MELIVLLSLTIGPPQEIVLSWLWFGVGIKEFAGRQFLGEGLTVLG
jgi:hypothetical protein